MTDMISAMRVDPHGNRRRVQFLPQDVQAEAYDYPLDFFKKRVRPFDRRPITQHDLNRRPSY